MNKNELSKILKTELEQDKTFREISKIVKENSEGKIWLIGSLVYKDLANRLYNLSLSTKDYDFIVDKIKKPIILPEGWNKRTTKYGQPKFYKDEITVDILLLETIHSITTRNLEPNIDNYLSGVPFSIQSIVYDLGEEKVIGNMGINALLNKTVEVNNQDEYKYSRNIHGDVYSTERYANILGFKAI